MKKKSKTQWVHFVGMCGVTMAPLANMFKDKGYFVTGSDKGIYAPMSEYIKKNNLNIVLGYKPEHLTKEFYEKKFEKVLDELNAFPNFIIVGNFTGPSNPEYRFAEKNNIKKFSFPEILAKYLVKPNSIVTAGTYGKTTNSALLSMIFDKAGLNPSYMFGGISGNFDHGVRSTDSNWSIIEGDEYISARWDVKSKFFHYSPKYVLLTSAAWDHSDIYKTEQEFVNNMKKLVDLVPEDGLITACINGKNVDKLLSPTDSGQALHNKTFAEVDGGKCKRIITYSTRFEKEKMDSDYFADDLIYNKASGYFEFNIYKGDELITNIETKIIGLFNYENITGSVVHALELGVDINVIKKTVKEFKGIKRRLEMIYENENIKIMDDFAASPPKVKGAIEALQKAFPNSKLVIIHDPNTGSRSYDSLSEYDNLFEGVEQVFIPRLRATKQSDGDRRYSGDELTRQINKSTKNAQYISNDLELLAQVKSLASKNTIIVFMGSGSFRGMREKIVGRKSLQK